MIFNENDTHTLSFGLGSIKLLNKLPEDDFIFPGLWEAEVTEPTGFKREGIWTEDEIKGMVER